MPIGTKNSVIKGCGLHHVALQTRDWAASLHLYQEVLGMQTVAQFGSPEQKIVLLDMGDGSHLELFAPKADLPVAGSVTGEPFVHLALATTDTRAALEHVRQAGYKVTVEPKDLNLGGLDVTIAFFKGPNGEVLEFFETH